MTNVKDYKKEYKELYLPKSEPMIIEVPEMAFVAVQGMGNPNDQNGTYHKAIEILYGVQYTIKMSKKGNSVPAGYFDYVVPPLEGFWWLDKQNGDFSIEDKSHYHWISAIRLPEFVDEKVFTWACTEASRKKKIDTHHAKYLKIKEGLCVQCLHTGAYDNEPETLKIMHDFMAKTGLQSDINNTRRHHEIYLSDPRKTEASMWKTVLRIPVRYLQAATSAEKAKNNRNLYPDREREGSTPKNTKIHSPKRAERLSPYENPEILAGCPRRHPAAQKNSTRPPMETDATCDRIIQPVFYPADSSNVSFATTLSRWVSSITS